MSIDRRQAIKQYIAEELLEEDELVADDENLLTDGMVDSLGMLRLVGFIEESFGIHIPPEDFVIANFKTVNDLENYLAGRSSS